MAQVEPKDPSVAQTVKPPMQSYPAVEALIESGDFKALNASFKETYDKLEHVVKDGKGFGRVTQAKKAIRALELSADLLRHLVQIKHAIAEKRKEMQADAGASVGKKM